MTQKKDDSKMTHAERCLRLWAAQVPALFQNASYRFLLLLALQCHVSRCPGRSLSLSLAPHAVTWPCGGATDKPAPYEAHHQHP